MTWETTPLRIFYLEDNPLIIFHVEAMIEDLGHIFAGSANSFAELMRMIDALEVDGVLVDIDLADGRTGPDAAVWLKKRGIPALFVTGQQQIAVQHQAAVLGFVRKPISASDLSEKLKPFRHDRR
jgi:CheY-like chemotaxis protein